MQLLRVSAIPSVFPRMLWMLVMALAFLASTRPCAAADRPITVQVGGVTLSPAAGP